MKKFEFEDETYIGDGVHGRNHGRNKEAFQGKKGPCNDFSPRGMKKAETIILNLNKTFDQEALIRKTREENNG